MSEEKASHPDYVLAAIIGILLMLGIVILVSVSAAISQAKFGSPTFYLFRHISFGLVPGLLLGFAAYKINLKFWKKHAFALLAVNLVLMTLVFFPVIGMRFGGASRWLNLFGLTSLQPSELLKITTILYFAAWLPVLKDKHKKNLTKILVPFLAILGLIAVLLSFQPDISTLGIIAACIVIMYFAVGTPFWHTLAVILTGAGILGILVKIAPYRMERILVFLNPDLDPLGKGYQMKQALIATGSGGLWGKGLSMSLQKFGFLPEPMADSIFAVFSEEMGFFGGLALLFLFLIFAWRGLKIARQANDGFSKLAAIGITYWIITQAFVNIGATIRLLPLSGVPLPFISYGGTALIAELIGVGLLLNISKHS